MAFPSRRSFITGLRSAPSTEGELADGSPAELVGIAHLWAAQFQQIMNLALAGAGGLLILVQTDLVTIGGRWWAALLTFIAAALVSMVGQMHVVEEATAGRIPARTARSLVALAFVLFGGSLYLLVRIFMEAAG